MKAKFQAYLKDLFQRPVVDKFQTPARRRAVAVGVLTVQALAAGLMLLIPHGVLWPLAVVFVAMIYLLGMLNMSTRGIFELADEHLDEYQVAARDAAFRKSYYLALIWLLLVPIVAALAEPLEYGRVYAYAFVMLGFLWSLSAPTVVAAWAAPADVVED